MLWLVKIRRYYHVQLMEEREWDQGILEELKVRASKNEMRHMGQNGKLTRQ